MRTEKLMYTEFDENGLVKSNKYYLIKENPDGTSHAEWGRYIEQGGALKKQQETTYPTGKFDTKVNEKLKKGYTRVPVADAQNDVNVISIPKTSIEALAIKQIKYSHPQVPEFIKYLCQTNVHQITSNTALSYNKDTGVFSTPMGLLTQDGIDKAREYLSTINNLLVQPTDKQFQEAVGQYMRIIPQDIGRSRVSARQVFPDLLKVQQQNDILDGLEASLTEVSKPKKADNDDEDKTEEEKLFDTSLELLEDEKEIARITKLFTSTAKDMHYSVKGMKIKRIFVVSIAPMVEAYDKYGKTLTNQKELWHGTGTANLLSILKSGFKVSPPSTAAIAGKAFGNGIYFAIHSTKSLQYARGVWSGGYNDSKCYMFLNDIAMGNYYVPRSTTSSNPPAGHDSYWAQPGKTGYIQNDEIIVFNAAQVKPKYLLELE